MEEIKAKTLFEKKCLKVMMELIFKQGILDDAYNLENTRYCYVKYGSNKIR